uniref:Beta-2-microglobulin n=1 Tax=Oryzias latipes TaxID=8090 RepID=H2MAU9_ORYLA
MIVGAKIELLSFLLLLWASAPPTVQVYSRDPGQYGKENTLICHVSNFHPPDITIRLMEDDQELPEAKQTDLAFKQNWHFHLTKSAPFTPKQGARYTCKVTHSGLAKDYTWGESSTTTANYLLTSNELKLFFCLNRVQHVTAIEGDPGRPQLFCADLQPLQLSNQKHLFPPLSSHKHSVSAGCHGATLHLACSGCSSST